jgi:hypothetical protein
MNKPTIYQNTPNVKETKQSTEPATFWRKQSARIYMQSGGKLYCIHQTAVGARIEIISDAQSSQILKHCEPVHQVPVWASHFAGEL